MRPRLQLLAMAAVATLLLSSHAQAASTSKRKSSSSSNQDCEVSPFTDEEHTPDDGDTVRIDCSFDRQLAFCNVNHDYPEEEGRGGGSGSEADFQCHGASPEGGGSSDVQCGSDSRVWVTVSGSSCTIEIRDSEAKDTGEWRVSASGVNGDNIDTLPTKSVDIYTYEEGELEIMNQENQVASSFETTYNYNERHEKWEEGKNIFETVEFTCESTLGRPEPHIIWFFEGRDNQPLDENGDQFEVTTSTRSGGGGDDWTKSVRSTIRFDVDDELMKTLERYGVETNPESERVSFRLGCKTELDMGGSISESYAKTEEIDIDVTKSYDNGALPANSIGMIVGIVLAVLILVLAIALVLFLKASGRACFAEDDYDYNHPGAGGKQPRSNADGGRHHQQQRR